MHSKLGTLYAATGQFDRARTHLEAVARFDPDNSSGFAMLGWLAYLDGRSADAIDLYRKADNIEPFNAKINYHWGLALVQANRWADAAEEFEKVLRIDPRHTDGCIGLAHALRQQGRAAEAVRYAWRAARLGDFRELQSLVELADAYSDAGRFPEAAAAANKVLELDGTNETTVPFDVRQRMETIRTRVDAISD